MVNRKGIVLAGGRGTRLRRMNSVNSKRLLTHCGKPLIYYSLSVLLLFSTAEAFVVDADSIGQDPGGLVLGDDIFFGVGLTPVLDRVSRRQGGATVFCHAMSDARPFGVATFGLDLCAITIEEKPQSPVSNHVAAALYHCDNRVVESTRNLKPPAREESNITDVHRAYPALRELSVEPPGRGIASLATGASDSILGAANFVATVERRQGPKAACMKVNRLTARPGYRRRSAAPRCEAS